MCLGYLLQLGETRSTSVLGVNTKSNHVVSLAEPDSHTQRKKSLTQRDNHVVDATKYTFELHPEQGLILYVGVAVQSSSKRAL